MSEDQRPAEWSEASLALPRPAAWTTNRVPLWLRCSMGLVVLIMLGLATEAAWLAWTGDSAAGVPLAATALYLGHIVGLSTRFWRGPRPSRQRGTLTTTADGTTGVRFGYSGWSYYWITTILVMTELVWLAVAAGAALSGTLVGLGVAAVAGILAVWMGWFLVTMLRLAPGSLLITAPGICHRSLTTSHFISWDAMVVVAADWIGTPVIAVKAVPAPDTRIRRYMGRLGSGELRFWPFMVIRTGWLASDPIVVYHALSFYHAHPELRGELATPKAVARIGGGRAIGDDQP